MTESDPTANPSLNEETPPLDAAVAVGWWHQFEADGKPKLDDVDGFHNAEVITDGAPPPVADGEIVTESGIPIDAHGSETDLERSHHLYMTHREALDRGITPCADCFPAYASEHRLDQEREEGGLLTEPGVEGAVFALWTRYDLESRWELDSVHESYPSMLYRKDAIRAQVGSIGGRLRFSYAPTRRCAYTSVEEAMESEPLMAHVSELRNIQPEDIPAIRSQLGDEVVETPIEHEYRRNDISDPLLSVIHRADNPPCGYERTVGRLWDNEDYKPIREILDGTQQTVADIIERGDVVEFCESCFPELVSWEPKDE